MTSQRKVVIKLLILSVIGYLGYAAYQNYEIVTLPNSEDGMLESIKPGAMLLLDLRPQEIRQRDIVVFRLTEIPNDQDFRVARVWAVPGDQISLGTDGIQVNGVTPILEYVEVRSYEGNKLKVEVQERKQPIHKIPEISLMQAKLFPDELLLFNDNINSSRQDSQVLGFIPRKQVIGKLLRQWPW